jgi:hypothetical protein
VSVNRKGIHLGFSRRLSGGGSTCVIGGATSDGPGAARESVNLSHGRGSSGSSGRVFVGGECGGEGPGMGGSGVGDK